MSVSLEQISKVSAFNLVVHHPGSTFSAPISWVASSDLEDPTQFLGADQLLLTTGHQFEGWSTPKPFADYVERLKDRGIVGLGFGTEIYEAGTPQPLIDACHAADFPLVQVPYETPFIAIAQWAVQEMAAESDARNLWSRRAQRAVSLSAIRNRDLSSILETFAQEIDGAAFVLDTRGAVLAGSMMLPASDASSTQVVDEALRLTALQTRSGSSLVDGEIRSTFQTLGEPGQLLGVLVVQSHIAPDSAALAVITTTVALCEIALSEARQREDEDLETRRAIFALLVDGQIGPALSFPRLRESLSPLPGKLVVALTRQPGTQQSGLRSLSESLKSEDVDCFIAPFDDHIAVITGASKRLKLRRALGQLGIEAGISQPVDHDKISRGCQQAELTLSQRTEGAPIAFWEELAEDHVMGFHSSPTDTSYARLRLAPVLELDNGNELVELTRIWFSHNCRWEVAATEAGLHRHVFKRRVEEVEALLDIDLNEFPGRVELWALISAHMAGFTESSLPPPQ